MTKKLTTLLMLFVLCISTSVGKSYSIGVGETLTLQVPSVSLGYVDKAIWACSNSAITFVSKSSSSATIKATKTFEGYATIELIYVEKYVDSKGFTRANTYSTEFYVSCTSGSSSSTEEATSISIEPKLSVAIGEKAKVYYQLYPQGSTASVYCSNSPGTYFNGITNYTNSGYIEGWARAVGTESVSVYFYNSANEKVSARCDVEVYDPTWVKPQSISLQPALLLLVGESKKLMPFLSPRTATTTFKWGSGNSSVFSLSNGTVKAKTTGTAVATVQTSNGLRTTCDIVVIDEERKIQGMDAALNRAAEMILQAEIEVVP